ncbi:MAG: hypothetical protein ABSG43_16670 [Solirubrobacteraceae bacterium]|jgi:hypothetical protein
MSATAPRREVILLRYIDAALVVIAAPIMLLIGVPARGYLIAGAAWIALRALGVAVDRRAGTLDQPAALTLRLSYLLGRLFAVALVVVFVRRGLGRDEGLTALIVIVFAFTMQLIASIPTVGRSK